MARPRSTRPLLLLCLAAPLSFAAGAAPGGGESDEVPAGGPAFTIGKGADAVAWDRRAVEHLWNRAGFGIPEGEIDRWVQAGPQALVDHLLAPRPLAGQRLTPSFTFTPAPIDPIEYEQTPLEERRKYRQRSRKENATAFRGLRARWLRQIVRGDDPLRDRMCMFWHGVFTSSYADLKHPVPIIQQHDTLRDGALGSYAELLRRMLRDPALLKYLNNDQNRKGKPNENLAREVMELFSLGEGHYTEKDVQEAARALTGAGVRSFKNVPKYRFAKKRHDRGEKTVLGETGAHGPEDLATILLAQEACPRFVARSIIEYLEGVPAAEERVETYAALLRSTDYDVGFLLRRLLLDPGFYRDDVRAARVASPVDYLVGTAIRLEQDVPTGVLADAAASLGQDLFQPPNVKGWDEGLAWISTATFMLRGNFAGALLGQVDTESMRADAISFVQEMGEEGGMMESMTPKEMRAVGKEQLRRDELAGFARALERAEYDFDASIARAVSDTGARTDREISEALLDLLLAIPAPSETVAFVQGQLTEAREAAGVAPGRLVQSRARSEDILREVSHLILSLPEAQLH